MRYHYPLSRHLGRLAFLALCAGTILAAPRLQRVPVGGKTSVDSQATPIAVGINIDPTNAQFGNPTHDDVADLGASWVRIEYKVGFASACSIGVVSCRLHRSFRGVLLRKACCVSFEILCLPIGADYFRTRPQQVSPRRSQLSPFTMMRPKLSVEVAMTCKF